MPPPQLFLAYWRAVLGDLPPLADVLRKERASTWLRVYWLENGKLPASAEDAQKVETILENLTSPPAPCFAITAAYASIEVRGRRQALLRAQDRDAQFWRRDAIAAIEATYFGETESATPDAYWDFFVSSVSFEQALWFARMAVNESIDNLTLCLPDKGLLLHPYGGGVDCFFDDAAERARVANVFSANLSKRADGL